jgi:hypothetical protein
MEGGTVNAATGVGNGKGLSWNQMEMLALARAAPVVLQDATIGANQNASVLGRRLLVDFLRDEAFPDVAECTQDDKSNRDSLWWHGGSAAAAWKCWLEKFKKPCVRLHTAHRRINVAELTGGPYSDDSVRRLATAMFNSRDGIGSQLLPHAYDILQNEHYVVGPPFPVPSAYDFLSKGTNLLADGMDEPTTVDVASDDRRGDGLDAVGGSVSDANADDVDPIPWAFSPRDRRTAA